ncbi:hypothetical protein AVEN_249289-1, partial [Araneus ventricosus]
FHPTPESFLKNVMDYRSLTFRFYLLNFSDLEGEDFPSEPFIVNAYHSPGVLVTESKDYDPKEYAGMSQIQCFNETITTHTAHYTTNTSTLGRKEKTQILGEEIK